MSTDSPEVIAFTISAFCLRHGISRSMVYALIKRGDLEVLHYSEQTPRITRDAEQRFLDRMAERRENAVGSRRLVGRPRKFESGTRDE